jgi:crotonobetainyl-CoA:carnitine CoA-transferase CaiB-like acyl-CoA transferase
MSLDFQKPEAIDLLRALVAKVDIVVENYGPGVLQKRGLDYEALIGMPSGSEKPVPPSVS